LKRKDAQTSAMHSPLLILELGAIIHPWFLISLLFSSSPCCCYGWGGWEGSGGGRGRYY